MRPFTRIAGILLSALALGFVVLVAWTAIETEVADLRDRWRRAQCTWVDPLLVSVAGHELSITATPETTVFTGVDWLHGEEVSGYREARQSFAFCLDAAPEGPLAARAVTVTFAPARALAARAGLPVVDGQLLEIGDASMFLADAPPAVGQSSQMLVYAHNPDQSWPWMVMAGTGPDGLRIGAVCRDENALRWLCDVSAFDAGTGLSFRFAQVPVTAATFDARPVPAAFHAVAVGMRRLAGQLEADALARR